MTPVLQKQLDDLLAVLTQHIDSGVNLDPFTLRGIVDKAEKIPDEAIKLMTLGLAYGAAGKHTEATDFFKEAVKHGGSDIAARNYLSYLSHTGQYVQYREEAVRLARIFTSFPLYIRARNAAYADGDGELSLFFARSAFSMMGDEQRRESMERDVKKKDAELNLFIETTALETAQITALTREVVDVARQFKVLAVSHDYYSNSDGDAAIICDILCLDEDVISDMDLEIATRLAMNDIFADKNITAWFRGRDKSEVPATV
ncbi:hypothetical protein [Klebsiella variicola]|uniref:hypothetical protein n=1 Tax=Klebsiella variicola TaxID=244366 RepID=UPI0034D583F4